MAGMMTAEELKNSILQLAFSGKLIPQEHEDGTGENLLKTIKKSHTILEKAGVVPKEKKTKDITEEEKLFDVPDSWTWTRIGELFQHNTGKALNGSNREGKILTYITTSNLYWNRFELDKLKTMPFTDSEIEKCTVKAGDLLVCEGGDFGRAAIWNYSNDMRIQNHIHRLRSYEKICTKYFYYWFNFLKTTGQLKGKGIAIQGLSSGALHNLVVPLPPLAEQKRIVAKIEELIPFVDQYASASTRLNTLNTSFPDQMKKSILQQAVQGKLVPQDPNDEPASVLLEKIAKEKEKLIKEGKIKKQKPLTSITEDEIPFEIPENWKWIRLQEISKYIIAGGDKPEHFSKSKNEFYKIPVFSNGETNKGLFGYTDEAKIDEKALTVSGRGTIGYTEVRDAGFVPIVRLIVIATFDEVSLEFLKWALTGLLETGVGSAVKQLTVPMIVPKLIPIPPYNEQIRIVNKIKTIMTQVDVLHEAVIE